jgi:hypothetical protein
MLRLMYIPLMNKEPEHGLLSTIVHHDTAWRTVQARWVDPTASRQPGIAGIQRHPVFNLLHHLPPTTPSPPPLSINILGLQNALKVTGRKHGDPPIQRQWQREFGAQAAQGRAEADLGRQRASIYRIHPSASFRIPTVFAGHSHSH